MTKQGRSKRDDLCFTQQTGDFCLQWHDVRNTVRDDVYRKDNLGIAVKALTFWRMRQSTHFGSRHYNAFVSINHDVMECQSLATWIQNHIEFVCSFSFGYVFATLVNRRFKASNEEAQQSNGKQFLHGCSPYIVNGSKAGIGLRLNEVLKIRASIFLSTSPLFLMQRR